MIYGRSGERLTIQRLARIEDVKALEGRKPLKRDREAIADEGYVIVTYEDGDLGLYHRAYLRADSGAAEINAVLDACKVNGGSAL